MKRHTNTVYGTSKLHTYVKRKDGEGALRFKEVLHVENWQNSVEQFDEDDHDHEHVGRKDVESNERRLPPVIFYQE